MCGCITPEELPLLGDGGGGVDNPMGQRRGRGDNGDGDAGGHRRPSSHPSPPWTTRRSGNQHFVCARQCSTCRAHHCRRLRSYQVSDSLGMSMCKAVWVTTLRSALVGQDGPGLICSRLLAHFMLDERLHRLGVVGHDGMWFLYC